jgi:hypothetical protein
MAVQPPQQPTNPQITIAEPSVKSLLLQMLFNGEVLSIGTGFIANGPLGPVLVTNRHNVTGRHQETGQPLSPTGSVPNEIVVMHNQANHLGQWVARTEPLYNKNDQPLWIEHPDLGARADFVALPLTQLADVQLYPYTLGAGDPAIMIAPAEVVSVVGFPFGLTAGGCLAVWATGFVASDPDIDYADLPVFLIDCRSRQGQSGSAVIAHRSGGAVTDERGNVMVGSGVMTRFLGIYSGRINKESDLGIVWKALAIQQLVNSIGI